MIVSQADVRVPASDVRRAHVRIRRLVAIGAFASSLLGSGAALASGGVHGSTSTFGAVLTVVGVGAVYLALAAGFSRLRRSLPVVPGLEHVLLGLLLGPFVLQVGRFGDESFLLPFAALASAWVALACGVDFNLRMFSDLPRGGPRLGVLSALVCGSIITVAAWFAITSGWLGTTTRDPWLTAGWLGCVAATASASPFDVLRQRYDTGESMTASLTHSVRFSNLLAIVAFGALLCVFQSGSGYEWEDRLLSPVELAVIAVGLGGGLGVLFSPYLGQAETLAGRVLVVTAMAAFASGAAHWLGLSTLWVNLALGAVLVNTSLANERVTEAVKTANPGANVALLVLAGALFAPSPPVPTLLLAGGFILLRLFGRLLASMIVAKWIPQMRGDAGRGLLAQGQVAVALGIAFRLGQDGTLIDIGYNAVLLSVLFHDFVAPWALRGLLLDAGELRSTAEAKL